MIVTLILVRMVEDAQMVSIVTLVPAQLVTLGKIATQVSQECNFVNSENDCSCNLVISDTCSCVAGWTG